MNQLFELISNDLFQGGVIVGVVLSVIAFICFGFWMNEESPRPSDFNHYEGRTGLD